MDVPRTISLQVRQLRKRLKAATVSGAYTLTKYCITCKNLRCSRLILFRRREAKASASLGCRYCIFILNAVEHFSPNSANDDEEVMRLFRKGGRYSLLVKLLDGLELELYTPAGHPPAWPGIFQDANPLDAVYMGSPRTSEAYEFIRSCLRDCDANHRECKTPSQGLPTRLLDVQHEGAQQVRLVETASLPVGHRVTYIALSYCWGKGQSLTLRSENLGIMKLGLMVSSLPQTLQDAITVTRALGQQYLWVDALCIIQDLESDWQVESSQMASIYRGAYLTIAAATASSAFEGFLSRNNLPLAANTRGYREPYCVEWISNEGSPTILGARLVRSWGSSHWWENGHMKFGLRVELPWTLRGWVLQEQLLSRRLLTYHAHELRWACQNKLTCQCNPDSTGQDPLDGPVLPLKSAATARRRWKHIVHDYTARELTNARDKLPAISGLAKVFQEVIGSPYIAGMWVNYLSFDLLWVQPRGEVEYAPEQYIAPSFSWASISSPVREFEECRDLVEWVSQTVVEDIGSVVDGKDPMGRLNNGWIKLRGYIFKAALVDHSERQQRYFVKTKYLGETDFENDTWLEAFEATNEHGDVEISVRRIRRLSSITPQDNEPSLPGIQQDTVVYLFWIGCRTYDYVGYNSVSRELCFLVLGLSSDKPGMYERLGLLKYKLWDKSGAEVDDWISGLNSAADDHKVITIV